MEVVSCGQKI